MKSPLRLTSLLTAVLIIASACDSAPPQDLALTSIQALTNCTTNCTKLAFGLSANLRSSAHFYDLPFPSDLRLDTQGRIDWTGFPRPASNANAAGLVKVAKRRRGHSVVSAAYFGVSAGKLAERDASVRGDASPTAPLQLLDIDADSSQRGVAYPVVSDMVDDHDGYTPIDLLEIAPFPGVVLRPNTTYAYVVLRSLGDARGQKLGVEPNFEALARGTLPVSAANTAARTAYAPLWPVLRSRGIGIGQIANATVFTTGDIVQDAAATTDPLVAGQPLPIENVALDQSVPFRKFCKLTATVRMPQYQSGTPPFDRDGIFTNTIQRFEQVPLTITIPRKPQPRNGYPVLFYLHGTDGSTDQVIDRETPTASQDPKGPAHVLADDGFVTVGMALPLNPQRLAGANRSYLNFQNLGAYPGTFVQGMVENRLLFKALYAHTFNVSDVEACTGSAQFLGRTTFVVDTSKVHMFGHSHGSAHTYMTGAVDPSVTSVILSGAGGYWSFHTLKQAPGFALGIAFLGTPNLRNYLHPVAQLLQSAWEIAEPMAYAPRLGLANLPGRSARQVYQPTATRDSSFSTPVFDAVVLAGGFQRIGAPAWDTSTNGLFPLLNGFPATVAAPAKLNILGTSGQRFTGVTVQVAEVAPNDGHHITYNRPEIQAQYRCFLTSLIRTGTATVPALGEPCP